MQEIITRAGSYVFIIILGMLLRKAGVFKKEDFRVLSNLMVKVTLPAAIIYNFAGSAVEPSLLPVLLIGMGGGLIGMGIAFLITGQSTADERAFAIINLSGYNVSCFTLPFLLGFIGTGGMIATGLFDSGNAAICLGGAYAVAAMIKDGTGFSLKKIGKSLIKTPPFDCFLLMLFMNSFGLNFPAPVLSVAEVIGGANAFVAMLMIGVGFNFPSERSQLRDIGKFLLIRYITAAVLALICLKALPYALEVRQAIAILLFSPITSAAPAFTGSLNGDVGLSSTLNSMSILCSLVFMVTFMMLMA